MNNKLTYRLGENLLIFRYDSTKNKKIHTTNSKVLQTYTVPIAMYEYARSTDNMSLEIFEYDKASCLDCPMRGKKGKCYTHKFYQRMALYRMLRDLPELKDIPDLPKFIPAQLYEWCIHRYIRFGTFGEPVFIPLEWVTIMVSVASSWTGYTHAWRKEEYRGYSDYFMASVDTLSEHRSATEGGWRTYFKRKSLRTPLEGFRKEFVHCPASKESGRNSYCSKCALCSGLQGKGKKSIFIKEH